MRRYRILIVDDEPDLLTSLVRTVKAAGFDVSIARDGESAILEVARFAPDLILSDVIMPGLNGFQATRKLKENEASTGIPVLLMSAMAGPADRFWAEEVGAVALLRKPLDTRDLVQRIEDVLAAREQLDAPKK
ncbi:MAG: response regulator [Myxococcales bacterium]|nr:response regulator [Myxococcales bacterium]